LLHIASLQDQRKKFRKALLRWHPDKFGQACGKRLVDLERDVILERVKEIFNEVQAQKPTA
jgi:curved DNA-binding protein CbpA